MTTTNTGAGAPPFFYLLFWEEDCQILYFSSAGSIMTDTPWPASPTTYKLQMWLLQMVSWERHTITNWNGASRVAGLPGMTGKCYESSSDKVNRECECVACSSLWLLNRLNALWGSVLSQYKVQVALIKTETRLFSSRLFSLKISLHIATPAAGNFPTIDFAVKRRRRDQKYIVMRDAFRLFPARTGTNPSYVFPIWPYFSCYVQCWSGLLFSSGVSGEKASLVLPLIHHPRLASISDCPH